jgi:DNA-binding CsgD family transcriptional regulator
LVCVPGSGSHRNRWPAGGSCPVREHRHGGREQCGADGDQGFITVSFGLLGDLSTASVGRPTARPPSDDDTGVPEDWAQVFWTHYWDSQVCAYPARTGDLRSIVKTSDFYSMRQWHSTGMYIDCIRPQGIEHHLMLALPGLPEPAAGTGRYLRLVLHRGPGPDFSERDRALLVLLRPHLHQARLDAERRRHPVPRLTPRQNDLMRLLAAGHTNTQIARRLGISEATVRTHLENIYDRLGVSSRTAAVTRAFPDRVA